MLITLSYSTARRCLISSSISQAYRYLTIHMLFDLDLLGRLATLNIRGCLALRETDNLRLGLWLLLLLHLLLTLNVFLVLLLGR